MVTCHICGQEAPVQLTDGWFPVLADQALADVLEGSEVTGKDVWLCPKDGTRAAFGELIRRGRTPAEILLMAALFGAKDTIENG